MQYWYERFGYDYDPLSSKPEFGDDLVDADDLIDELIYRIDAGSIIFIEGENGSGKTALLYQMIDKHKGHGRVIYFDCNDLRKNAEIDLLMKNRYGFLGRLLNMVPKNMIVLLDNVQALNFKNAERVKFYFDQNYIKSLIFTGTNYSNSKLTPSIKDRIGTRIIKTRKMSESGAIDLLKIRLGEDQELMPDNIARKIYRLSGGNPKIFLDMCSALCRYSLRAAKQVSDRHFKAVYGDTRGRALV